MNSTADNRLVTVTTVTSNRGEPAAATVVTGVVTKIGGSLPGACCRRMR